MFTIAGGIVLGFGAIWLILYLVAHSGEIAEFIEELPKLIFSLAVLMAAILLPLWAIGWAFNKLPDMGKAVTVLGCVLLFIICVVYCAVRDFRRWLRRRHEESISGINTPSG